MSNFKSPGQIQYATIDKYRERDPSLVWRGKEPNEEDLLNAIGIAYLPKNRVQGFIKLSPHDFIVEEIRPNGKIVTIEPEKIEEVVPPKKGETTLYCDLVKMNTVQTEATGTIAEKLGIPAKNVTFPGIKDKAAITSQRIGIQHAPIDAATDPHLKDVYLKNFKWGTGKFYPGNLWGNRFTIFVRTPIQPDQDFILNSLAHIQMRGCYNFFHLQRFGNLRLVAHKVGIQILKGNFDKAVLTMLAHKTPYEMRLIQKKRDQALKDFPNMEKIEKSYAELPISFRMELKYIRYLIKNPGDYIGALKTEPKNTQLSVQAYASYLFNLYITTNARQRKRVPQELPLFPSSRREDEQYYGYWLRKHGLKNFLPNLQKFPGYFSPKTHYRATRIKPKIHQAGIVPEGAIISFELPTGSYATTFLNNFFVLFSEDGVPRWVRREQYDIKATIGIGSVLDAIEELKKYEREIPPEVKEKQEKEEKEKEKEKEATEDPLVERIIDQTQPVEEEPKEKIEEPQKESKPKKTKKKK
ncbi:tRNA pseudouridine(13) synthase TruD [Patescibacteria group bacterium]|nr:tRNA pseudouridine(13) synthase TruD [Patescibacteria group bacterium]